MLNFLNRNINKIVIVLLLLVILVTLIFLYNNFYKVYTQADEVLVMQNKVSAVAFKNDLWDKVNLKLEDKLTAEEETVNLRNPFILE